MKKVSYNQIIKVCSVYGVELTCSLLKVSRATVYRAMDKSKMPTHKEVSATIADLVGDALIKHVI